MNIRKKIATAGMLATAALVGLFVPTAVAQTTYWVQYQLSVSQAESSIVDILPPGGGSLTEPPAPQPGPLDFLGLQLSGSCATPGCPTEPPGVAISINPAEHGLGGNTEFPAGCTQEGGAPGGVVGLGSDNCALFNSFELEQAIESVCTATAVNTFTCDDYWAILNQSIGDYFIVGSAPDPSPLLGPTVTTVLTPPSGNSSTFIYASYAWVQITVPGPSVVLIAGLDQTTQMTQAVQSVQTQATIPLGATFSLGLANISSGTQTPLPSTFTVSNQNVNPSISQATLFSNDVVIEYNASAIETTKSLHAVHYGSALVEIVPTDTTISPVGVLVNVVPPAALGSVHNEFDSTLISLAQSTGIPPQFLKGQARQEAGANFNPEAYRYEPLSVDLPWVSSGKNLRSLLPYSLYRLATSDGLAQGSNILSADIAPRSIYDIVRDGVLRPIASTDTLVSALEIFQNNDDDSNWSTYNPLRARQVANNANLLAFTAQTSLAASYGLLQILYTTAIAPMNWQGIGGQQNPSFLFDIPENTGGGGSLQLSAGYLRRIYLRVNPAVSQSAPIFTGDSDFEASYSRAFNAYNHASASGSYGVSVLNYAAGYQPVASTSIFANN